MTNKTVILLNFIVNSGCDPRKSQQAHTICGRGHWHKDCDFCNGFVCEAHFAFSFEHCWRDLGIYIFYFSIKYPIFLSISFWYSIMYFEWLFCEIVVAVKHLKNENITLNYGLRKTIFYSRFIKFLWFCEALFVLPCAFV